MIYILPFISALIGWFTNFLAVKMLFHPKKKIKIGFIEIQGIFPKRQKPLAEHLAKVVAKELVSFEDIKQNLKDPNSLDSVKILINEKLDEFLTEKFPTQYPVLAVFVNKKVREKFKRQSMEEIELMIPLVIDRYIEKTEQSLDIECIVYEKVVQFSSDKLEDIVFGILKNEFFFIEMVGGILGFLIGCIQLLLMHFFA